MGIKPFFNCSADKKPAGYRDDPLVGRYEMCDSGDCASVVGRIRHLPTAKGWACSGCGTTRDFPDSRHTLSRATNAGNDNVALWIMLNPSTADATTDDPTIRRVISFSEREGCGRAVVVNLYPIRATKPAELWSHPAMKLPWYSRWYLTWNAKMIREHIDGLIPDLVICGWGATGAKEYSDPSGRLVQAMRVLDQIERSQLGHGRTRCLGRTKAGHPRHPLYVRADQPLERFP